MDVKEYLTRINYNEALNTDALTLKNLCDCHMRSVPFEMFDMFGGQRKVLSLEKIYNDIVTKKRGGFCYENNYLFTWLLQKLGFNVTIIQGQVYNPSTELFGPKCDHMCMLVTISGDKWLVDVGFGGTCFVYPLRFIEMETQEQRNGAFRIRSNPESEGVYFLEKMPKLVIKGKEKHNQKAKEKNWKIMYKFTTQPQQIEDFIEMCDFHQDSELSFLKYNAVSSLQTEEGNTAGFGMAICKKKYIDPYTEEIIEVIKPNTEEEFKEIIKKEMGIELDFPLALQARDFTGFTEDL